MVKKTWPEWLEYWKAVASERGPLQVPREFRPQATRAEWEKVFEDLERTVRPSVDRACRRFVRSGAWPPRMTVAQRWFVGLRVHHALQLSLWVLPSRTGNSAIVWAEHLDDAAAAEWMLTDAWWTGADHWETKITSIPGEARVGKFRAGAN